MCNTKNYTHAIGQEIELRLNGFQTALFEGEFQCKDRFGLKYKMTESKRTNVKFEDIQNSFIQLVKKGGDQARVYMVPENEVPKAQLLPNNQILMVHLSVETDKENGKKIVYFWTKEHIKTGHIMCIPPSTIQMAAEIAAMEHVGGVRGNLSLAARGEVDGFEDRFAIPQKTPEALCSILHTEDLCLPSFTPVELNEGEYEILTDNNRPGNSEQRKFVCNALSTPDFSIMVGPPGSGKTTAILELIIQLVKRGKRILLVASTNVAVDNILEKLKEHLDLTCVKRYGCEDNPNISADAKKFINGKPFMRTEAKALQNRLEKVPESKRTEYQQEFLKNCDVKDNQLMYEILLENAPIVAGTTFGASLEEMKLLHDRGEVDPPFDYLILDEASKTTIQEFLVPACLCKRWVIVGDIQQLPPYVSDDDLAENL
ncbi:MAG: AAA family ATPase, partial [Fibrobacter sp.]|nr:AAA family ATPase [Fibrobacter sp.]